MIGCCLAPLLGDDQLASFFQKSLTEDAHRFARKCLADDVAVAEHDGPVADRTDLVGRVGDQKDGPALFLKGLDPVDALALKTLVAHSQYLVDHQNVGVDVDRHGKAETHVHARGVELHRSIDECLELGEVDDGIEDAVHFLLGHAQEGSVEVDVLPPGQVLLEARAQLEQTGQFALDDDFARSRLEHAADALEQGRLARPVPAQDPDRLTLAHLQGDVLEGPEVLRGGAPPVDDAFLYGVVAPVGQPEPLRDVLDVDRNLAHRSELLGEVALEPSEDRESDEEENDGQGEHPEVEREVPEIPVVRQHVDRSAGRA